jgi:hypothetical protein
VLDDSRCPGDAICVTAGDATIRIHVSDRRVITIVDKYELRIYSAKSVNHGDVTITLVDLAPYPFHSRPFDPSEYRATLRITR